MSQQKKKLRAQFREAVFARDGHKCAVCGATEGLDAHHILDRHHIAKGGSVLENGISLCVVCHVKAEVYHASRYITHVEGFLPEDLYRIIGSSTVKAFEASK